MPINPDILPALDNVRTLGDLLGLRVYTVTVRLREYAGERPGMGGEVISETVLTNAALTPSGIRTAPPLVRHVRQREIIASGGLFRDKDFRVGPFTPPYSAFGGSAGWDKLTLDPSPTNSAATLQWIMTGPDIFDGGEFMEKIQYEATALHHIVWLRATGQQRP